MLYTKLSTVVKAVRLRWAVPIVLVLVGVYWTGIYPWTEYWGSTAAERQMVLPGDGAAPQPQPAFHPGGHHRRAAEIVWQWLAQIGQDRAGFYSYTWLENLLGGYPYTMRSAPSGRAWPWEGAWRMLPADYMGGAGRIRREGAGQRAGPRARARDVGGARHPAHGRWFPPARARRIRAAWPGSETAGGTMVFTMERRMLLGLKARAEGARTLPLPSWRFAWLGWAAAWGQRGRPVPEPAPPLALAWRWPVAAALPALLMGMTPRPGWPPS